MMCAVCVPCLLIWFINMHCIEDTFSSWAATHSRSVHITCLDRDRKGFGPLRVGVVWSPISLSLSTRLAEVTVGGWWDAAGSGRVHGIESEFHTQQMSARLNWHHRCTRHAHEHTDGLNVCVIEREIIWHLSLFKHDFILGLLIWDRLLDYNNTMSYDC